MTRFPPSKRRTRARSSGSVNSHGGALTPSAARPIIVRKHFSQVPQLRSPDGSYPQTQSCSNAEADCTTCFNFSERNASHPSCLNSTHSVDHNGSTRGWLPQGDKVL